MVNFKRLTVYLLTFLVVSVVVILLVNFRDFDHYLVGQANKTTAKTRS